MKAHRNSKAKSKFPDTLAPMLSTLTEKLPEGNWLYEIKWDGYRALAFCNLNHVSLISRNNKSFNEKYYPIYQSLLKMKINAIFDGEIVVLNDKGISSFEGLQNWRSEADGELYYYVFDLIWLNGEDLKELPLTDRKKLLKSILQNADGNIRFSESFKSPANEFYNAIKSLNLEGVIAKKADSLYYPGLRSLEWLKIKAQKSQEVVIGGYTLNEDSPKPFSALLVGIFKNGIFQYAGKVGTGFSINFQKNLINQFKPLIQKKCPFILTPDINKPSRFRPNPPKAKAVWLSPKLIAEVKFSEITSDGLMRHPSFKGMRKDKEPKDVILEKPKSLKKIKNLLNPPLKGERKSLLNPIENTQVKIILNHELKFTNLRKVFWPKDGYTKRDLINYYYQIAPFILPYLKDRPQSLNRFPNGIQNFSFYQKDVTANAPEWIEKYPYHTSDGKDKNFLVVKSEADLLWMANLGSIEMNAWNSTIKKPNYPTWCIIDLDPSDANTFDEVIETAQVTKQILDKLKVHSYCKTSGSSGLHIYIPLGAQFTYEQCQQFGRDIATQVHLALPKFTSIERLNINRRKKVYIDFLQNRPKATLAAPYSIRPKPCAPVSMPLHWSEVKKGLKPIQFTIRNAIERIKAEGDLFKPVLSLNPIIKTIIQ